MADTTMTHSDHVVVDVAKLTVEFMEKELEAIKSSDNPVTEGESIISRIDDNTRRLNKDAYDPKFLSIGPLHFKSKMLTESTVSDAERLKWKYLYDLIGRSPDNKLETYVNAMVECEEQARRCYPNNIDHQLTDSSQFVTMLVLDGCFTIEYLIKYRQRDLTSNASLLRDDLLRLENQLPYFVLVTLFEKSTFVDREGKKDTINQFVDLALHFLSKRKGMHLLKDEPNIHHLVHLSNLCLWNIDSLHKKPESSFPFLLRLIGRAFYIFLRLSHRFSTWIWGSGERSASERKIPPASKLWEMGIELRRKKGHCLLQISFKDGVLEIPQLVINKSTFTQFVNILAFEDRREKKKRCFTSYAHFMTLLVKSPADLELLEKKNIVKREFSSEDVLRYSNRIRECVDLYGERHFVPGGYLDEELEGIDLSKVYKKVYMYKSFRRWRKPLGILKRHMAKAVPGIFDNPLVVIPLIVAAILLVLSAVQTFFTMLGYFLPPK